MPPSSKRFRHRRRTWASRLRRRQSPSRRELLAAGQRVRVKGFKQPVVLRRHDGRSAEVEAGPLRMKVLACGHHRHRIERCRLRNRMLQPLPPRARERAESQCTRSRATRPRRRNQRHRLHGGGSHAPRRQIPRQRRAGWQAQRAHHSWPRHRRAAPRPRRILVRASAGRKHSMPKPKTAAATPSPSRS